MSEQAVEKGAVAVAGELSSELVQKFATMAMVIPDEAGDAVENILAAILAAPTWEKLDEPWDASGAAKLAGVVFRIDSVIRRPSRYRDGMGVFLVVHCTHGKTGEKIVWTTSSTSVVAQLVVAYCREWLPIWATVVVAEKPTDAGYYPHHLHFYGPAAPGEVAAK